MPLDNIQLTPFLIEGLFKKSLVAIEILQLQAQKQSISSFNILGKNQKQVALIVENPEELHLADDQLNFLLGVLSACKLTMEDVAIINIAKNTNANYKTIEIELKAEKIILFGVKPSQIDLPLEFPLYQIQQYNKQTYVAAASLDVIQIDKIEKTKLWNCLKQIFTI